MEHKLYKVVGFKIVGPSTLSVEFDDGVVRVIDFGLVLNGPLYGPLQNHSLFQQVKIDPEISTLVWPNGADFDPETLHNWPRYAESLASMTREWDGSLPKCAEDPGIYS